VEKDIFIALGSNVGDRELNLLLAVAELAKIPCAKITALSPFYDTEPVGMVAANFLNAVLRLECSLPPEDLLSKLMRIETEMFHRKRNGSFDSRRMDLDILFYGGLLIDRPPEIVIPHPRLHERRFVLEPLAEIAPEYMHPRLLKTVRELLLALDDRSRVTKT